MADSPAIPGAPVHEYSIVSALLDRVEAEARARGALAVSVVSVAVGRQSGVEAELLAAAFEVARVGTVCGEARLDLRAIEPAWSCRACGAAVAAGGPLRCAACGAPARMVTGDEILLERLELEVA
jgi:hydrogenase nickel insertion protein HypA